MDEVKAKIIEAIIKNASNIIAIKDEYIRCEINPDETAGEIIKVIDDKIAEFPAYDPFIRQLRADKGWRVEFDVSEQSYDRIKELPKLQDAILRVTVTVIQKIENKTPTDIDDFKMED